MDTQETPGAALQGDNPEARRQAASLLGQARTEAKAEAARANAAKRRGVPLTEEHRAKIAAANAARWAEKRTGDVEKPKGKPGRPRTRPEPDATAPKRGRGRPKKEAGNG